MPKHAPATRRDLLRQTTAVLLAPLARAFGAVSKQVLLVANKADDTLAFVDIGTLAVIGTAPTGHRPHELAVAPDGRTAVVANYGAGDSLSLFDVPARRALRKLTPGGALDPHGVQFSRDGRSVFVTSEVRRAVVELDVGTGRIVRTIETGQDVTHMLVLDLAGSRLYTANIRSGTVTAIDLEHSKAIAQIDTGAGCEGIDITPDGRFVWTSNKSAETLSVIDTMTLKRVASVPCVGRPIRVKITPDGRAALVTCARSGELVLVDVSGRKELKRLPIPGAPIGLAIEPGGQRAFVAQTEADRVSVVDLARWEVVGTVATGHEPDGLAVAQRRSNEP